MNKISNIIILLSFLILGALVLWQINHLKESHQLKAGIQKQEMQSALLQTAIELRKAEKEDDTIREDTQSAKTYIEKFLAENFKKFNTDLKWGFYNGLGEPIDGLNDHLNNKELQNSDLKVCLSCLIMIGLVDNIEDVVDREDIKERGYMLDQTPAQMRHMQGLDESQLRYIHITSTPLQLGWLAFSIPMAFLIGLSSLFIWLLHLNKKQSKLILQKNEFVNHLSHQFQTPLSSIKLSAILLAKKETNNQDELVQIIQTESNRLENHIKTVLHWVKSDADRLYVTKETISLTDIIERSLKQMKPVFLANNTTVNFIPPNEELHIFADVNHLQLMLFNIWENAIKHNEKMISLNVDCYIHGTYTCIRTSDNGKGLQEMKTPEKFKGLGLNYIRSIMNEHNGTMELITNSVQGLSVHLNFPNND